MVVVPRRLYGVPRTGPTAGGSPDGAEELEVTPGGPADVGATTGVTGSGPRVHAPPTRVVTTPVEARVPAPRPAPPRFRPATQDTGAVPRSRVRRPVGDGPAGVGGRTGPGGPVEGQGVVPLPVTGRLLGRETWEAPGQTGGRQDAPPPPPLVRRGPTAGTRRPGGPEAPADAAPAHDEESRRRGRGGRQADEDTRRPAPAVGPEGAPGVVPLPHVLSQIIRAPTQGPPVAHVRLPVRRRHRRSWGVGRRVPGHTLRTPGPRGQ